MNILIACEFSGRVREAFIAKGHNAISCDLLPTEIPGPHYQCDVLKILDHGWDLMIAHPPCTYLSNMSNCRSKHPDYLKNKLEAFGFFIALINAPIPKIAIENPRGFPEREYKQANQIIQPYQFGDPYSKATCLWLKDLPLLIPTNIVPYERRWDGKRYRTWVDYTPRKTRSITFQGIANAMADQWSLPG